MGSKKRDTGTTSNHMVCQFEDCVDVLIRVMHSNYLFVFLFDHLLGHAKQSPDRLNAANMKKVLEGKVPPHEVNPN